MDTCQNEIDNHSFSQVTRLSVSGFYFLDQRTKMKMRFDISYLEHILYLEHTLYLEHILVIVGYPFWNRGFTW